MIAAFHVLRRMRFSTLDHKGEPELKNKPLVCAELSDVKTLGQAWP